MSAGTRSEGEGECWNYGTITPISSAENHSWELGEPAKMGAPGGKLALEAGSSATEVEPRQKELATCHIYPNLVPWKAASVSDQEGGGNRESGSPLINHQNNSIPVSES